ncbi:MAG: elongation factor 4 [Calditrichaeota bacterium]|nr:elongation factor 4 [Calditrichota bacterium]MCB9366563.1 elongation factor 4 [Calditrichota bacterium]MCB9391179.1 elongation factor 4 [Calditrichota bacterium]
MQPDVRNFCIIAHIDHGKSTLADRLLEETRTLDQRKMTTQVLDNMDLEKERGITIKMHPITMQYTYTDGKAYTLNLIDTPGHVDFTYEVSRSLKACEGAVLVVDATQGIEAQTLSNLYLALEADLEILPVLNKVDLAVARPDEIAMQVGELLGVEPESVLRVSGKTGLGVPELLRAIVERIPAPRGKSTEPLRALIFDSQYDTYRGAIAHVRVVDGKVRPGQKIIFAATQKQFEVQEVGVLRMAQIQRQELVAGDVGYVVSGCRDVKDIRVGDTIFDFENVSSIPLAGYREVKPMVFAGIYPADNADYELLRDSLGKLSLNDSALIYDPETSVALGFGFRVGFLGLLHFEVIQERLEREYNLDLVCTVPSVEYRAMLTDQSVLLVDNPVQMPAAGELEYMEEPYVRSSIITPEEYIGSIMQLCIEARGTYINTEYLDGTRVNLHYEIPLAEIIFDFYDRLKSISRGYASFDYEILDYRRSELTRLDILVNGEVVDALSVIVHKDKAYDWGRRVCDRLVDLIPRQMFEVAIQAAVGSRVIARSTVRAMRKNVLAKCYGGDITRKRKLLEKQKAGKKRMKAVGNVEIPQEAFLAILKAGE